MAGELGKGVRRTHLGQPALPLYVRFELRFFQNQRKPPCLRLANYNKPIGRLGCHPIGCEIPLGQALGFAVSDVWALEFNAVELLPGDRQRCCDFETTGGGFDCGTGHVCEGGAQTCRGLQR